jgi:hypothetical protein
MSVADHARCVAGPRRASSRKAFQLSTRSALVNVPPVFLGVQEGAFIGKDRAAQVTSLRAMANIVGGRWNKNKAADVVYRQRPCQPRKLKSAHAFR